MAEDHSTLNKNSIFFKYNNYVLCQTIDCLIR